MYMPSYQSLLRFCKTYCIIPMLLLSHRVSAACNGWFNLWACEVTAPYCNNGECTKENGVDITWRVVHWLITDKPLSVYAQSIVVYLLGFVTLVAVIYIIYAGFQVLIGGGDEEKMKKAKNIILYVIVGIVLMWFSYSIVLWILNLIGGKVK